MAEPRRFSLWTRERAPDGLSGPWRDKPATPKQLAALARLGLECPPTLTRGEAFALISARRTPTLRRWGG